MVNAREAKSMEVFETAYKRLNPSQKKAVDTIEGPVMVIAGPGTGKTQILALRIANILKNTDTQPANILAITFTESGVFSMRERLLSLIGQAAYKVSIYTFHGFAQNLISNYPEEFPRIIDSKPVSDIDQIRIFEKIIDEGEFSYVTTWGNPYYYIKGMLSAIKDIKRGGFSPDRFKKRVVEMREAFDAIPDKIHENGRYVGKMKKEFEKMEKDINKLAELGEVYERYEIALMDRKLYDFEDMLIEAVSALGSNEEFLRIVQEDYQYVLADEHQDANRAQNTMLELLVNYHDSPNLFIVGDEKQAIYRFQGASLENFLYFSRKFKNVEVVQLTENYRSTQKILDAAHSLILNAGGDASLRIPLQSQSKNEALPLTLAPFSSEESELLFLSKSISSLIDSGVPPCEIAVLARNNSDVEAVRCALDKKGIALRIDTDADVLDDSDVKALVSLFGAILNPSNDELLAEALFVPFIKINPLVVFSLLRKVRETRVPLHILLSKIPTDINYKDDDLYKPLITFINKFENLVRMASSDDLPVAFESVVRECGVLEFVMQKSDSSTKLSKISALFKEAQSVFDSNHDAKLVDFFDRLSGLKEYGVSMKMGVHSGSKNAVRLMTAHASKGLEFEHVFIARAVDGRFGNRRKRNLFVLPEELRGASGDDDDERRLFYVAITRAKTHVTVSWSHKSAIARDQLPTAFVSEIDAQYTDNFASDNFETENPVDPVAQFVAPNNIGLSIFDPSIAMEALKDNGLSVSALNNYYDCAWKFFFVNLVRIPKMSSYHQLYGIAVHAAMKDFADRIREGEDVGGGELIASFIKHLERQPLSQVDFNRAKTKGEESLREYYKNYQNSWHKNSLTEVPIRGVLVDLPRAGISIPLNGMLDKIEVEDDGRVRVIDYKTGRARSRNEIMGETKSSDENYYRQLVFYRLLVDEYFKGTYTFDSAMLDFIEPTKSGEFKRESFTISDEEVIKLREDVIIALEEIVSGEFLQKGDCDNDKCEWCDLRKVIQAN